MQYMHKNIPQYAYKIISAYIPVHESAQADVIVMGEVHDIMAKNTGGHKAIA